MIDVLRQNVGLILFVMGAAAVGAGIVYYKSVWFAALIWLYFLLMSVWAYQAITHDWYVGKGVMIGGVMTLLYVPSWGLAPGSVLGLFLRFRRGA